MTTPPELIADDIAEPVLWSAKPEAKWTTFDMLVETMDQRTMRKAVLLLLACVAGIALLIIAAVLGFLSSAGEAWPHGYSLALLILAALVVGFFLMGLLAVPVLRRFHPPIYFALTQQRIGRRLGHTGPWDDFAVLDEVDPIERWQSPGGFRGFDFTQSRLHPDHGMLQRTFRVGGLTDGDADALEAALKHLGRTIDDRPEEKAPRR